MYTCIHGVRSEAHADSYSRPAQRRYRSTSVRCDPALFPSAWGTQTAAMPVFGQVLMYAWYISRERVLYKIESLDCVSALVNTGITCNIIFKQALLTLGNGSSSPRRKQQQKQ